LTGVGGAIIITMHMGMSIGINELNLNAQGIIFPVSGWNAVPQTVEATLISLISYGVRKTSFQPVFSNASFSLAFY